MPPPPPSTEKTADQQSPRLKTVHRLLKGYSSLSVPTLLSPLSQTFTHTVLPASLGMPVRDRASFAAHAEGIFSIFSDFKMVPVEMYEDSRHGTVTVHARMEGTLKGQGEGQKWENECVMIVRVSDGDEEGEGGEGMVVEGVSEFVDSAKAVEMGRRHAPRGFGLGGMGMGMGLGSWAAVVAGGVNSCVAVYFIYRFAARSSLFSSSWMLRG